MSGSQSSTKAERMCRSCEAVFLPRQAHQQFCTTRCRRRERSRRWAAANPDKAREGKQRWAAANPDKVRERSRRWAAANPDKARDKEREKKRRRTAKRAADVYIAMMMLDQVFQPRSSHE